MVTFEEVLIKYCKELLDTEVKKQAEFSDTSIISIETYT